MIIREEYKLLNNYSKLFNQRSINNETAGIISFFVLLGQAFKEQFVIPIGALNLDVRVSCFWLQDTRSGKSIAWDFINEIAEGCFLFCESPDEWSDAGLIGTVETDKEGNVTTIEGILGKCDILQIDEASSLFMKKNYNQSTILYLQKALNYLYSKTNIIKKQLKAGEVTCEPHCSLWLTSFPPKEVIDEVLEKGFFQRVIFYPNRVSLTQRKEVSGIRINGLWKGNDNKVSVKNISDKIMELHYYYKSLNKKVLEPDDIENALSLVNNKVDGLYKVIEKMEINNQIIMSTFMSNFENNIAIFSTLLAISRKSNAIERIDILQAYDILYDIFTNISSWIEAERTDKFKADRELITIVNELRDEDGWISKSLMVKEIEKRCEVSKKTAYNRIEKILLTSKKGGYIKCRI